MSEIIYDKSRVINFSDAVFSIAMTLLVLEIDIPDIGSVGKLGTLKILQYRIPSFIGVLVSSLVTVLYWVSHLRVMKYVTVINNKLLWLNIALLISIVMLPFSTAFYVGAFDYTGPFVFYALNITVIGLFNFLMILYVKNSQPGLTDEDNMNIRKGTAISFNGLFWWITAAILAFVIPFTARFLFIMIFIIEVFIKKYFDKQIALLNNNVINEEE